MRSYYWPQIILNLPADENDAFDFHNFEYNEIFRIIVFCDLNSDFREENKSTIKRIINLNF